VSKTRRRGVRIDLTFSGKRSKLEGALSRLGKSHTSGVMIGTWPTPEKTNPGRDVTIQLTFRGTKSKIEQALMKGRNEGVVAIDTVPMPD